MSDLMKTLDEARDAAAQGLHPADSRAEGAPHDG